MSKQDESSLIEAASALLSSLRELLAEAEAFEESGDRFDRERNDRARVAIARAEGK